MNEIHLLYFKGCPNAEEARRNLVEALGAALLPSNGFEEVDTGAPGAREEWRGFPSPTVLVNGVNVDTGEMDAKGDGACRLGGAPSVEQIVCGIKKYSK